MARDAANEESVLSKHSGDGRVRRSAGKRPPARRPVKLRIALGSAQVLYVPPTVVARPTRAFRMSRASSAVYIVGAVLPALKQLTRRVGALLGRAVAGCEAGRPGC